MSQNTLERLIEQRDVLHDALMIAEPGNIGRVSSEYRNTLLEIDRLEREANAGNNMLASVISSLSGGSKSKD